MHDKNIGAHRLDRGGYRAAQTKWEKEDAELLAKGKPNPFDRFTDPQARNFVRARYRRDPKTDSFSSDDAKVKELEKYVVRKNLLRIKSIAF
jgi:hypothetical protein